MLFTVWSDSHLTLFKLKLIERQHLVISREWALPLETLPVELPLRHAAASRLLGKWRLSVLDASHNLTWIARDGKVEQTVNQGFLEVSGMQTH